MQYKESVSTAEWSHYLKQSYEDVESILSSTRPVGQQFYQGQPVWNKRMLKEEEVLGLQPDFEHVLEAKSLLDSVRIVRPDFLRVLLFFVLKTNESLQKNCLLLLKHLLESKNRARRRED